MKVDHKRSVFSELKDYCIQCGDHDYMEVTEWSNCDGHDIVIERKNSTERFSLSYGEWKLLQILMNWEGESE